MTLLEKFKNSLEEKHNFPPCIIFEWIKTGKITKSEFEEYVKSLKGI